MANGGAEQDITAAVNMGQMHYAEFEVHLRSEERKKMGLTSSQEEEKEANNQSVKKTDDILDEQVP